MEIGRKFDRAELGFALGVVPARISDRQALADPSLLHLIVEDAVWQLQMRDWQSRQPRRWRREKLKRWVAEGTQLFEDREQLKRSARELGL